MKLPENLRRIRKDNNLSQEQLAEKLGVSRQAVSKWESGQSYPEMDKMLLICKLFNYNIDELMNENVKEVNENKQSKININKYIEDFFGFINKTIDMFSVMRFRDTLKCFLENVLMCIVAFAIFIVLSAIGGHIFANGFGFLPYNIFRIIRSILEAFFTILYLVITITILLHIFKVRYLDYYEIVKIDKEDIEDENKTEIELEKGKKIFVEKNKEKIIIRDPGHSQSKFLNGIARIILWCIKFIATFIGLGFAFTFIGLITLLILSFLFVKTGVMFIGVFLGLIAAIIINFLILEEFYNFIVSKKTNKTKRAVMFISALVIAGISIGLICIGVTQFNFVEDTEGNSIEEVYEIKMADNLLFNVYGSAIKYVETDSDKIKIVVEHSKYYDVHFIESTETRKSVHCFKDNTKFVEFIRDIIKDINNKEIKDYSIPMTHIYTSKENIQRILKNN